jgi:hypothetical protein
MPITAGQTHKTARRWLLDGQIQKATGDIRPPAQTLQWSLLTPFVERIVDSMPTTPLPTPCDGRSFVLDGGFVCLVDGMGDDQAVVQAARGAMARELGRFRRSRIDLFMRHRHSTPFEMAEVKLLVRVPWIVGGSGSAIGPPTAYSTRYSLAITRSNPADQWRSQAATNGRAAS